MNQRQKWPKFVHLFCGRPCPKKRDFHFKNYAPQKGRNAWSSFRCSFPNIIFSKFGYLEHCFSGIDCLMWKGIWHIITVEHLSMRFHQVQRKPILGANYNLKPFCWYISISPAFLHHRSTPGERYLHRIGSTDLYTWWKIQQMWKSRRNFLKLVAITWAQNCHDVGQYSCEQKLPSTFSLFSADEILPCSQCSLYSSHGWSISPNGQSCKFEGHPGTDWFWQRPRGGAEH